MTQNVLKIRKNKNDDDDEKEESKYKKEVSVVYSLIVVTKDTVLRIVIKGKTKKNEKAEKAVKEEYDLVLHLVISVNKKEKEINKARFAENVKKPYGGRYVVYN